VGRGFGSVSTEVVETDRLGRPRRALHVRTLGSPRGDDVPVRFDLDDLEAILRGEAPTAWPALAEAWPEPRERMLLPWAVVHAAVHADRTLHAHLDALCTLAGLPDAAAACAAALGERARWLPFAAPGPDLARAIPSDGPACVLVRGVGVIAWGEAQDDLDALVERLAADAARYLGSGSAGEGRAASTPDEVDGVERLLVTERGRLSAAGRRVLSVDPTMRAIAERPDVERIAREAPGVELPPAWAVGVEARLVPGLGQIAAGRDEADARATGVAAAHAHRVAATLIDRAGGIDAVPVWGVSTAWVEATADRPARGRVYIVTGAASGIGRDIARHLAGLGAQVGLGDLDAGALELVADELEPIAGRPVVVAGDLTDEAVVDLLVRSTVLRFGGIDGAVLNAGVAIPGEIRTLPVADWRRSLDVNATSHFLLVKRLLPVLEAQGIGGSLVFVGSKNMFSPGAGFGAYSASKAALAQLARVVAIEAGPMGVRSNIVNPDNVFEGSALWSPELRAQRAAVYGIKPEELEAYYTQRNLMKVPITGRDVAKATAFLLSDEAERTTACVLTVDGGVPGVFPR